LEVAAEPAMETDLGSILSLGEKKKKQKNVREQKIGMRRSSRLTAITKLKSPTHRSPKAKKDEE
jgi:hypothetical protein